MFFAPAVLALTKPEMGNHLKILCLSTGTFPRQVHPSIHLRRHNTSPITSQAEANITQPGDAVGLGETRKKELQKSALQLGLRDESDVFIVNDPARFPDSMTANWSEDDVSTLLASAFAPDLAASLNGNTKAAQKPPSATIDALITFDHHGISNHPNHRSLYHGAVHFLRVLMKDKAGYTCPVTLYTLTSVSVFRKYAGVFDAPVSMFQGVWSNLMSGFGRKKDDAGPARLLFVSSIGEWLTAQAAMVKCHKSQMVWFRWGWITIGRYMTVNDLKREHV